MPNPLLEYVPETEVLEAYPASHVPSGPPDLLEEGAEIELAAELLETTDEPRRRPFLEGLMAQVASASGYALPPPLAARLRHLLARNAERVFPLARSSSVPGGTPAGAIRLMPEAGHLLGLELEGLSPEDQEFEAARGFIRLAAQAVRNAVRPGGAASADSRVNQAFESAARHLAPGLSSAAGHEGRWIRRGRTLVLLDC